MKKLIVKVLIMAMVLCQLPFFPGEKTVFAEEKSENLYNEEKSENSYNDEKSGVYPLSDDISSKDKLKYSIVNDKVIITGYEGSAQTIYVPDSISGCPVVSIADNAFDGNHDMVTISMPHSVVEIGNEAFNDCSKLTNVKCPGVEKIGDHAFFDCERLNHINGGGAFYSLKSVGKGAFFHCSGISSVQFGSELDYVGEYAFARCNNLCDITFSPSCPLQIIKDKAFFECGSLSAVQLPKNVKKIEPRAFMNSGISEITMPGGIEVIGKMAFASCANLSAVSTKAQIIEEKAFAGCTNLAQIELLEGVNEVKSFAFSKYEVGELKDLSTEVNSGSNHCDMVINIPQSLVLVEDGAFYARPIKEFTISSNEVYKQVYGALFSIDEMMLINASSEYVKTVLADGNNPLPDTIEALGFGAFSYGYGMDSINLSEGLLRIDGFALSGVPYIEGNTLPASVENLDSFSLAGLSFYGDFDTAAVASLGPNALSKLNVYGRIILSNVNNIEAGDSMHSGALSYATAVDGIEFSASLPEDNVLGKAFTYCNTKEYIVSSSELSVENGVLMNAAKTRLICYPAASEEESYTIPDTVEVLDDYAIFAPSMLDELRLNDGLKKLGEYSVAINTSKGANIRIPDGVTSIADTAIGYDAGLSKVEQLCIITDSENEAIKNFAIANDFALAIGGEPVVNNDNIILNGDETFKLEVDNLDQSRVYYSSTDPEIATIDENGNITPHEKGETYVVAAEGAAYYKAHVTVKSRGTAYTENFDYLDYAPIEDENDFLRQYFDANDVIGFSAEDNPGIRYYSSNDYSILKAVLDGPQRYAAYEEQYGKLDMFRQINRNISKEIKQFDLPCNVITYSGTNYLANWTGTGNTLADLYGAVGKDITFNNLTSTSIEYGTADRFANGYYRTVIEFYQRAHASSSVYLDIFSQFSGEKELLMNYDQSYRILDAGVKYTEEYGFTRYIKVTPQYEESTVLTLSNAVVAVNKGNYTYDGSYICPKVTVKYPYTVNGKDKLLKLTEGKDYILDYANNLNAGKGKVIVTGIGAFSGETTASFTINKADMSKCTLNAVPSFSHIPASSEIKSFIYLKYKGHEVEYEDFKISNIKRKQLDDGTDDTLITFDIVAAADGNFTGGYKNKASVKVDRDALPATAISLEMVDKTNFIYSTKAFTPKVNVTIDGKKADPKAYKLVYLYNIDAGRAIIYAAGINGYYGLSDPIYFDIAKADIGKSSIKIPAGYAGIEISQLRVTGKYKGKALIDGVDVLVDATENKEIKENNTPVTVVATGNNYTGTKVVKYKLSKRNISSPVLTRIELENNITKVYYGNTLLKEDTDYTKTEKTSKNKTVITVKGIGIYTGRKKLTIKE